MKKSKRLPVLKTQCKTCPFKRHSKYAWLGPELAACALSESSRICHSTGSNNAINKRTGKPPQLCRGARDLQLKYFAAIGFITEPTDAAWELKCKEINL